MLVLQYKCGDCASLFECLYGALKGAEVTCISCGSSDVERSDEVPFYPNKTFCPHDKELEMDSLKYELKDIMKDKSQRCGGCGTDGAPGKCKSGGGGCGSGGCGSGGCGGGGCGSKK